METSREKQIEEMARLMCANYDGESGFCGDGGICDHDCWAYREATHLYDMGYRKATDVVEEIFAEIENAHEECIHIDPKTNIGYLLQTKFLNKLAEIKDKYTEGKE